MAEKTFYYKYNHCKKRIKQWEADFRLKNGRDPHKADIKEAESKVKNYYKLYWRMKSTLLEQMILGNSLSEDNLHQKTDSDSVLSEHRGSDDNVEYTAASLMSDEACSNLLYKSKEIVDTKAKENVAHSAMGLPKNKEEPKKWFKSVSSKLFEGSSFKKRNPRKAFVKKRTDLSSSAFGESLSQSFVSETSFQSFDDTSFASCTSPVLDTPNQNEETTFSVENEVSPKIKSLIASPAALTPMFTSGRLSIITSTTGPTVQSLGITNSISSLPKPKSVRQLDVGWVERCNEFAEKGLETSSSLTDSGVESAVGELSSSNTDPSLVMTPLENSTNDSDDEDDLICDSDDDQNTQLVMALKRKSTAELSSTSPIADEEVSSKKIKLSNSIIIQPSTSSSSTLIHSASPTTARVNKSKNEVSSIKQEILEKKVKAGTLNDNYVKLNIKKKVFVRGKKNFNFSKHKKKEWKKKKQNAIGDGAEIGGILRCFKCGDVGHYARRCMAGKEDKLLPVEDIGEDPGLPSLAEAEEVARALAASVPKKNSIVIHIPEPEPLPADHPEIGLPQIEQKTNIRPLNSTSEQIFTILKEFGHDSFRPGQEDAVRRILSGKSTLLMLSTGGGKSLCYQLPAYMYHLAYNTIALVISPLVSLMDDQVSGTLSFLKIGCLHTNLSEKQRANVITQIQTGQLSALLVSPEAVVSCDNLGFGSVVKHLPPISFACIDEVHCVSQWSYNFRPSYLMLTKVLREKFGVKTFLGLTATASKTTVESITKELRITDSEGIIQDTPLPSYIHLKVSKVEDKDVSLLHLIKDSGNEATLVYCTRREECVRLATLIRTALRGVTAQPYHAGLTAAKRKSVQRSFMKGKLQVVVATVAFGMGINKQDIRHVYHYNMPKDWESYVQEVGRAGRDGQTATCHVLLNPKGGDILELRRHIVSNSVDRHVVRRLLDRVFVPCSCTVGTCKGHEVAFSLAAAVEALDLPEENITTLLCYLELLPDGLVRTLPPAYMTCKVQSYHGSKGLHIAAKNCPPLAVAAAQADDGESASTLTFDVIKLARQISWDSGTVKRYLKQAEWKKEENGSWKKSGIHIQFSDLGLRVFSRGDLSPEEHDNALESLIDRVKEQQEKALLLLNSVYSAFSYFSTDLKETEISKSDEIKSVIRTYFKDEKLSDDIPLIKIQEDDFDESIVAADVRHLVCTYRDNSFNGRAIARIFYGIQSPNYPASLWYKARQWRAHLDKSFAKLQHIADKEILRLK